MNIYDFIGETVDEPVRSNNAIGDVRLLWDKAQKQRARGQTLQSTSGKSLTYTLLYFVPGLTTYCRIGSEPVITGYMSGCYLFRYRYNGELRAAHVGTHDTLSDWSDKAKAAWKALASKPQVTDVFGFDPLKNVSTKLLMDAQKAGTTPQVAGIWEANGAARIAVFANSTGGKKILVRIEAAPLRPWLEISNDAKMR